MKFHPTVACLAFTILVGFASTDAFGALTGPARGSLVGPGARAAYFRSILRAKARIREHATLLPETAKLTEQGKADRQLIIAFVKAANSGSTTLEPLLDWQDQDLTSDRLASLRSRTLVLRGLATEKSEGVLLTEFCQMLLRLQSAAQKSEDGAHFFKSVVSSKKFQLALLKIAAQLAAHAPKGNWNTIKIFGQNAFQHCLYLKAHPSLVIILQLRVAFLMH